MRLLNVKTLLPRWFADRTTIPPYAILSHTWAEDEVSYEDMISQPLAERRHDLHQGIFKIVKCADQAMQDGLEWIWVDTCCIQKSSSAELSEAINSMYRWYQDSTICYAYLADLDDENIPTGPQWTHVRAKILQRCLWFTRGWTLQELITPKKMVFYSRTWKTFGTKFSLLKDISIITQIPESVLKDGDISGYSVAQRMSWAAKRKTTRVEDIAYCLLGIFDINMPLLYGEGDRAFQRLQAEIVKVTEDESLFAWVSENSEYYRWRSLFAASPAEFSKAGNIVPLSNKPADQLETTVNMTIRIELPLIDRAKALQDWIPPASPSNWIPQVLEDPEKFHLISNGREFIGILKCTISGTSLPIGIFLRKIQANQFIRVDPGKLYISTSTSEAEMASNAKTAIVTVKQRLDYSSWFSSHPGFRIFGINVNLRSKESNFFVADRIYQRDRFFREPFSESVNLDLSKVDFHEKDLIKFSIIQADFEETRPRFRAGITYDFTTSDESLPYKFWHVPYAGRGLDTVDNEYSLSGEFSIRLLRSSQPVLFLEIQLIKKRETQHAERDIHF